MSFLGTKHSRKCSRGRSQGRKRAGGDFTEVFKTITADNGSEFLDSEGLRRPPAARKYTTPIHIAVSKRGSNEARKSDAKAVRPPKGTNIGKLTE